MTALLRGAHDEFDAPGFWDPGTPPPYPPSPTPADGEPTWFDPGTPPPYAPAAEPGAEPGAPEPAPVPPRPSGHWWRGTRLALRTLLRQRRRIVLAMVAVALGVGYLAGSLSLLQRVGAGLAEQAGAESERADLVVEGAIADDSPLQQVRKLVPDSLREIVAAIPGVAAVDPRLESNTTLIIGADGEPVVSLGLTERPLGANFPTDPEMNPYRFVGPGRPPDDPGEVVLDARSAKAAQVEIGDAVAIAGKTSVGSYVVVGIVEMIEGELPEGSSLALFETSAARTLFELGSDDNAIAVRLEPGADLEQVRVAISRAIFSSAEVSTGAEYAEHRQASIAKSFTMVRALLIGFAGLAVVVGAFTVANSMALLFDHRRRGFALLRLLGASPSQLVGAATSEALIGGAVAGVVGLVLGLGVGYAIEAVLHSLGTSVPVAGSPLTWWIPLVAVAVGAAVTALTALSPARQAARTPPIQAVMAGDRPAPPRSAIVALRWLALVVGLAAGAGVAGLVLGGPPVGLIAAGAGAAIAVVLVVLPRVLSGVVGAFTGLLLRRSTALRRMSALRSRQARTRAASTTAALLLATAVVAGLSVLSTSFVESVDGEISRAVTADLIVDSATFTRGGLSAELIPRLRKVSGVAAVSGWRPGAATVDGRLRRTGGVDVTTMFDLLDLDIGDTAPQRMAPTDIVISRSLADETRLRPGDSTQVTFQNEVVSTMRVRAVFDSHLNVLLGDVLVDTDVLAANLPQSVDVLAFVGLRPNALPGTTDEIERLAKRYGAPKVLEPSELVSERAEFLRGFGRVIQWMLAFSVLLALVGVTNTLQLGVNERQRELGLLRAVGATRRQVLRLVVAEAASLSIVGTVLGLLAGVGAAYATVVALSDYGLDRFVLPAPTVIAIAGVAVGLGLLGAAVPAARATRIPVLDAVSGAEDQGRRADGRRTTRAVRVPAAMALRCYHCGNEPGDGATCAVCGAPQTAASVDSFTARPEPVPAAAYAGAGHEPTYEPSYEPTYDPGVPPPITVTYGADIVDAAVVEDGVVIEPVAATYSVDAPVVDAPSAPTFDSRPAPSEAADPMRSPFGQHAAPTPAPPAPEPVPQRPAIFSSGAAEPEPTGAGVPLVSPVSVVPPAFGTGFADPAPATPAATPAPAAPAPASTAPPAASTTPVVPDHHGLALAVARLDPASQASGTVPFIIAGGLLAHDERVLAAVAGSSLGMPTVIVLTDRRVLIVSERRYVPEVESFDLAAEPMVHGRHTSDVASLTFGDQHRLVTVDQIADVAVAVELAGLARPQAASTAF